MADTASAIIIAESLRVSTETQMVVVAITHAQHASLSSYPSPIFLSVDLSQTSVRALVHCPVSHDLGCVDLDSRVSYTPCPTLARLTHTCVIHQQHRKWEDHQNGTLSSVFGRADPAICQ